MTSFIYLVINVLIHHFTLRSVSSAFIIFNEHREVFNGQELNVPVVNPSALLACVLSSLPVIGDYSSGFGLHEGQKVSHLMSSCDENRR